MKRGMNQWENSGLYSIGGKPGEGEYVYWEMEFGEVWPDIDEIAAILDQE